MQKEGVKDRMDGWMDEWMTGERYMMLTPTGADRWCYIYIVMYFVVMGYICHDDCI